MTTILENYPPNYLLTIAIPTYNRNEILRKNLEYVLPQLNEKCYLMIIDNNSVSPVIDTIRDLLDKFTNDQYSVIRNETNVGASANVMRCFERCNTEWIWVIGDDDTVRPDAIETIFASINDTPDGMFYNFSSEIHWRNTSFITDGVNDFIEKLDSFSNSLFISSSFYNARRIKQYLQIGYLYGYSLAPHFAALLAGLSAGGKCYFSHLQLVSWNAPTGEQQWSFLNTALRMMSILELVKDKELQRILAQKILRDFLPFEAIIAQLAGISYITKETYYSIYLLDHIYFNMFYFNKSVLCRLKYVVYRQLLKFPKFFYCLLKFIYKYFKEKNYDDVILVDLWKRI